MRKIFLETFFSLLGRKAYWSAPDLNMQILTGIAVAVVYSVGIAHSQSFRPLDGLLTEPNQEQGYYSFVKV